MLKKTYKSLGWIRGHVVETVPTDEGFALHYVSDGSLFIRGKKEKPCIKCGRKAIPYKSCMGYGIDACWGKLPGVIASCCGHGLEGDQAYVMLEDRTVIKFKPNTTREEVLKELEVWQSG